MSRGPDSDAGQTEGETKRWRDRQRGGETDKEVARQTGDETQRGGKTDKWMVKQTNGLLNRQMNV